MPISPILWMAVSLENYNSKVLMQRSNNHYTWCKRSSWFCKNVMVNAIGLAHQFHSLLPANEVPERTEGYEGFYHLMKIEGTVEKASLQYIIRDHDRKSFELKKKNF